jgi:hypothetical protein
MLMHFDVLYVLSVCCFGAPALAIVGILAHYQLRRVAYRRNRRRGRKKLGYYPSSFALGLVLQFMQVYWRPSVAYAVEEKQEEDADEDDASDPESPTKQLNRQLRRIRRGEPVDGLVLRL